MNLKHPLVRAAAPLVGLVIVLYIVGVAISQFQTDRAEMRDAAQNSAQEANAPEAATPDQESAPAEQPATAQSAASQPAAGSTEPILLAPADAVRTISGAGCVNCHVIPGIPGANGMVGPDLSTIGVDGAARIPGYTAADYIRESILNPNAFIAPECPTGPCFGGIMLQSFAGTLSDGDLEIIVSYLSTLGTGQESLAVAVAAAPLDLTLPPESVLEPFAPLPKDPASEAQIALGKALFFETRLSGNGSTSCATCHLPDYAFANPDPLSQGYPSTKLFRNTPTVLNTVFADYLYWDGRMDGSDMPTLVRDHLTESHFMAMDGRLMAERLNQVPAYVDAFGAAFGGGPSFGRVLNAIAAYVQSLNSPVTAYDLFVAGDSTALSTDAQAGLELFTGKAGCSECHSGPLLSDNDFHNTGVATDLAMFDDPERHLTFRLFFRTLGTPNYRNLREDVGLYALTKDDADRGKFRTPSLREVGRTAPYLHNGSLATLQEVVAFYNDGGGSSQSAGLKPLGLSDSEAGQLVTFLESLSSEPIAVTAPSLPDYQIVSLGGE